MDGCKYSADDDSVDMIAHLMFAGLDREGRGPALPQLPGVAAEEVGLRLGEVHLLPDRDMLGHQTTQMGTQCKARQMAAISKNNLLNCSFLGSR